MEREQVQEKITKYQLLQNRIEILSKRRELILSRMLEIDSTIESIEELKKGEKNDIFLPLGYGVYIPGTLKSTKKLMVVLGVDVAREMDPEDAKKMLRKNRGTLEENMKSIEKDIIRYNEELLKLEPEIRSLVGKK